MKNTPDPLPPDVTAYLTQATIELAEEYGFHPINPKELARWMDVHHQAIGTRASNKMWELFNELMTKPEMMDMACDYLGAATYEAINARRDPNAPANINPRFLEYCEAMGYSGYEDMKKRDKGSAASFICWCHANPRKQS
jgi:hypothetical protein